jgi:hypothetical protein
MAFIFIVHSYLMKVYSRIHHLECSEYVVDADLGSFLHIALKQLGISLTMSTHLLSPSSGLRKRRASGFIASHSVFRSPYTLSS